MTETAPASYDGPRAERLAAAPSRGRSDFFGAPAHRRIDREGFFHTR